MSSRALINSAAAGVAVINAMYMVSEVPTGRAAWGWQMAAPASADFTCQEGTVGCLSMYDPAFTTCTAANYTCTVTPKAHHECDTATITLKCRKNGTIPTDAVSNADKRPDEFACINNPQGLAQYANMTDSVLEWSATPTCTEHDHDHGSNNSTAATANGAQHAASPLAMGSLLVASLVAKVVV